MTDRISVKPKIMDLQNTNDIYMTMNIAILSDDVNFNSAQFTLDFIDGVIENKESYVGIPFLVNREKIENGEYDKLTHELNAETGELGTDQIGSFVDFWKEEIDGANCLMGSIKIFKRFPRTCEAITTLVAENVLETSCEVLIKEYQEITEDGIRKIHYNDGKNSFFGSSIVTQGAESRAKPTLLIAEAYQKDIKLEQKGGENLTKVNTKKDKIEVFNKGIDVKYHGKLETSASLKWSDVRDKIYDLVNPINTTNGNRTYNYWIRDLYVDYVILEDEYDYNVLYKASYKIDGETITIVPEEDWIKGSYGFIPEGVSVNELMEQNTEKLVKLNKELSELKEEKENMSKEKEVAVEELSQKIEGLEKEIKTLKETNETLEGTIVSQKEAGVTAEDTIKELNETVEELKVYKEQVETAEKESKIAELNAKYSKLLSEETFKSEDTVKMVNELNETGLNSLVVAEIAAQKATEIETASADNEDVVITASVQEDLVTAEKDTSYWSSPRS